MGDRQLRYVLGVRILASEFSAVLRRQPAPLDGVVALMDADLTILARTRAEDVYIGGKPTPEFAAAVRSARRRRGAIDASRRHAVLLGLEPIAADRLDGRPRTPGRRRSTARRSNSLQLLVTVGVSILGGGLLMTFVVRWRIVRAQVAAVTAARALARGEPTAIWTLAGHGVQRPGRGPARCGRRSSNAA